MLTKAGPFLACVAIALFSIMLRVWIRARLIRILGWDDGIMAFAMISIGRANIKAGAQFDLTLCSGYEAAFITAEVLNGLGRHEYHLESTQQRDFQALDGANWVQVFSTLMLIYLTSCRFEKSDKNVVWTRWIRGIFHSNMRTLIFFGICRPLQAWWSMGTTGTCLSDRQLEFVVIAQGKATPKAELRTADDSSK